MSVESCQSTTQEGHNRVLYLVKSRLDSIFLWAQEHRVDCYKTRITAGQTGWVVDIDKSSKNHTLFLLAYSHSVDNIMGTYYV
jgi:hypothetical protein